MRDSLSPNQRLGRLAAAIASWWVARAAITPRPDPSPLLPVHPPVENVALVAAFVFFVLLGFGCLVQAIQPQAQSPIRWFPPRADRGRLLKVIALELLLILSVVMVSVICPWLRPRAAVAGLGVWLVYLTLSRNPVLWEARGVNPFTLASLRSWAGDRYAQIVFVGLGLGLIAIAIFAAM